jgi:pilus assembly protein CpaE
MATKTMVVHIISREPETVRRFSVLVNEYAAAQGIEVNVTYADDLGATYNKPIDVLIIDLESVSDMVLQHLGRLQAQGQRPWIVATYAEPSAERLVAAMRAGVNDTLRYHPEADDIRGLFHRAIGSQESASGNHRGQIITLFSNKGGVGTTTVAINVAAAIKQQIEGTVCVVDLVLQHGDICVFLDVPTHYTVVSLINDLERADPSYLYSVLARHPSGVYVLPAPYVPDEAELVSASQIMRLLEVLRGAFDAVVVDAGNEFNEQTITALDHSDRLLLVTLPSLPSIRNTRRSLDLFARLGYDSSKLLMIANRHDAKEKVDGQAMEEALGRAINWSLPNDYVTVTRAINQGTALHAVQPKAKITLSYDQLVREHILRPSDRLRSQEAKPRRLFKR